MLHAISLSRRLAPTAAALFGAVCLALAGAVLPAAAAERTFDVAMFSDDPAGELIVVVRASDGRETGVDGTGSDARVLEGAAIRSALAQIRERRAEDDVSVVGIDPEGAGRVELLADDEDGSAYIRIGEGGIVIHAGEGEDSIHLAFGDPQAGDGADDDESGAVRIHARGGDDDDGDRAVVMIQGLDADATRDMIDGLDDVPRAQRRTMREALGL